MNSIMFTVENSNFDSSYALFEIEKDGSLYVKEVNCELMTKEFSSFFNLGDIDSLIDNLISARNIIIKDTKIEISLV